MPEGYGPTESHEVFGRGGSIGRHAQLGFPTRVALSYNEYKGKNPHSRNACPQETSEI